MGELKLRRFCKVCAHPERIRAELLLAKGDEIKPTARRLGMSPHSLRRHWLGHVSEEQRRDLVMGGRTLAAQQELAAQALEESTSVLDHLKAQRAALWRLYLKELEAGNGDVAQLVMGQMTKVNAVVAKITGELRDAPLLQQNFTTVHLHQDPQFLRLMQEIADVLGPFDEARRAVLRVLERLEAPPALPGVVAEVEALPAPAILQTHAKGEARDAEAI